jgi:hypothetical protein
MSEQIDLEKVFKYHAPKGDQAGRYESIRDAAKDFAETIINLSPPSREQTHAINKIQEAVMWANAGIARNE